MPHQKEPCWPQRAGKRVGPWPQPSGEGIRSTGFEDQLCTWPCASSGEDGVQGTRSILLSMRGLWLRHIVTGESLEPLGQENTVASVLVQGHKAGARAAGTGSRHQRRALLRRACGGTHCPKECSARGLELEVPPGPPLPVLSPLIVSLQSPCPPVKCVPLTVGTRGLHTRGQSRARR